MFLHDAEFRTPDYQRRHSDATRAQMGVWRWKGIQKHATRILELICGKRVLDFGGADGPLGFGSVIADRQLGPAFMASDDAGTWTIYPEKFDVVFTSHTLEHVAAIDNQLVAFREVIKPGGYLIVHVPAWTCVRWRPHRYDNPDQMPHVQQFGLTAEPANGIAIDAAIVSAGFDIELAEHCGDDSILVIARKPTC